MDFKCSRNSRLIEQTKIHLGMKVNKIIQLKTKQTLKDSRQYVNLFGTLSGNITILVPVPETLFKRLHSLYYSLVLQINRKYIVDFDFFAY